MIKISIMDGRVLLTSTSKLVVSSLGETTQEGADVNKIHPSMINPSTAWYEKFRHTSKSLHSKIKFKFESRAISVGVAMSPCNLGGKYRCRPHYRSWMCACHFFLRETEPGNRTAPDWCAPSSTWRKRRRLCGVFEGWTSVTHCPFQWKWRVI